MATIAIDYDDTFNTDPYLWSKFIADCVNRGHRVICVTARILDEDNKRELKAALPPIPIYFTSRSSKMWYMEQMNVQVDIWIDDSPRVVVHGH